MCKYQKIHISGLSVTKSDDVQFNLYTQKFTSVITTCTTIYSALHKCKAFYFTQKGQMSEPTEQR